MPWFGGKQLMVKHLVPLIPSHEIYVEAFGGGCALFFAKEPSSIEVYNDVDSGLVNFFRVLRDREKLARFYLLCCLTPYSREEYQRCVAEWPECDDEAEKAYRWFVVARSSFSGLFANSWGSTVTKSSRGMAGTASRWQGILEDIPRIHQRAMRLQVEHADFRHIIPRYDTEDTFFYLDPPYVPDTRKGGWYSYELTLRDHQELVELLLAIKGKAMLSGYDHPVYAPLEAAGWSKQQFQTVCCAAGRTRASGLQGEGKVKEQQARTETVWLSPRCETRADGAGEQA